MAVLSTPSFMAMAWRRHPHCVGEYVDTAQHLVASIDRESDFFGSHC